MAIVLEVNDLCKTFTLYQKQQKEMIGCSHVSFQLQEGEFIGITGKSGAGKSTLLKCLFRTYLPSSGEIYYDSNEFGRIDLVQVKEQQILRVRMKEIGYVSQFLQVLPRVTAKDIIMETLIEMNVSKQEASHKAEEMLFHFNIPEKLWDAYPNTFSGGEKLRLNLARAMVKKPRLLLLDEPTASLDHNSKRYVKEMIENLKQAGTSMIGIFHDLEFMEAVVDHTYKMKEGCLTKEVTI
ncbi:phosphonate C-P lyase system protein PhnL [Alkalihalobacterium bogoriense]|uniref:phosphonate C-P lyase system protein PhnL n=1 Tax=Alkalihalobacterium bogoriense TaxID=246272 RepID=UPI00047874B2|nr:phosphonate C-P lyase system protein PhnL [Alkalihalobacterium bogoriense]